jgi:hypothetical protein
MARSAAIRWETRGDVQGPVEIFLAKELSPLTDLVGLGSKSVSPDVRTLE